MNKMIKRILLIVVFIVALIAGTIYVYDPIAPDTGWPLVVDSRYPETGMFRIDPRTILTSLEQGDRDAFIPDSTPIDERYDGPVLYQEPVLWEQSDHLKIASTVNELVWKDDLNDWQMFIVTYNSDCQNNSKGLSGSYFLYFKTTLNKGRVVYNWRAIEISPEREHVAWGGGVERGHPLFGLKSIDLNELKITAEDAIRIAEDHGGSKARLAVQNQCNIHLSLMPQRYHGWWVNYGYSSGFGILIDPNTGRVIKTLIPPQLP